MLRYVLDFIICVTVAGEAPVELQTLVGPAKARWGLERFGYDWRLREGLEVPMYDYLHAYWYKTKELWIGIYDLKFAIRWFFVGG